VRLFDARLAIVEAKDACIHSPAVIREVERGKACNGATEREREREREKEREVAKRQRTTRGKASYFTPLLHYREYSIKQEQL
jgi:hypothetical protein